MKIGTKIVVDYAGIGELEYTIEKIEKGVVTLLFENAFFTLKIKI